MKQKVSPFMSQTFRILVVEKRCHPYQEGCVIRMTTPCDSYDEEKTMREYCRQMATKRRPDKILNREKDSTVESILNK